MHQSGGLKGVSGRFMGHFLRGELAQFVVNEREQFGRRLAVAGRGGAQELSDLGHDYRV